MVQPAYTGDLVRRGDDHMVAARLSVAPCIFTGPVDIEAWMGMMFDRRHGVATALEFRDDYLKESGFSDLGFSYDG